MMTAIRNQVYAAFCAHLGGFSFGYALGYSAPALAQMMAVERIFHNNDVAASWFGSIVTIGAIFGCLAAGWLIEHRGRKGSLILCSVPFVIGWLLIFQTPYIWILCLGRFMTGFASGMVLVSAPVYVAEVSSKDLRGMLGSGVQLSITLGILVVYVLGLVLDWRNLALLAVVFPFVSVFATLRAPESPRYLLDIGHRQEAVSALTWLRGSSAAGEEECRNLEESHASIANRATLMEMIKRPDLFRPLVLAVALMILQQVSGINVIVFYCSQIFVEAGFKEYSSSATVIVGAVMVAATAVACILMDRFGRRVLLIVASVGMAASCITLGIYYKITTTASVDTSSLSWLALGSLVVYVATFSLGWGPIPMLIMSEIFPARARGTASAVATITNFLFAFIVTKTFWTLKSSLGTSGTFWMYGAFSALSILYVWKFVPETKGKTLEDIELCFIGSPPLLVVG